MWMSYEVLEMTDELMLSDGKRSYGLLKVELNIFYSFILTEGCLIDTSDKISGML